MTILRNVPVLLFFAVLLAECGARTPTPEPTATPTPTSLLEVTLTTDSDHYGRAEAELQLTVTNHGDGPVYLPICGPWDIIRADSHESVWFIECEIDYLGHEIDPGESFSGSLKPHLDPGSYRARTEIYGECSLGEPKTISARETYYGEFSACTIREEIVSEPFRVE
jgi:hypothetical protein